MNADTYKNLTRESYDQTAEEYRNNTSKLSTEKKADSFAANLKQNSRILDLGCGPGLDAQFFIDRGHRVTGVDISPRMIAMASQNVPDADFKVMDIESIDFPPCTFDAVWASASLLHVPNRKSPLH